MDKSVDRVQIRIEKKEMISLEKILDYRKFDGFSVFSMFILKFTFHCKVNQLLIEESVGRKRSLEASVVGITESTVDWIKLKIAIGYHQVIIKGNRDVDHEDKNQ